jgi:hypothetical protein
MKKILIPALIVISLLSACKHNSGEEKLRVSRFDEVRIDGELKERIHRNFDRMEEWRYLPENIFLTPEASGWWPGDNEGRTILALVFNAQATGRQPKTLNKILDRFPEKLNAKGYFGDNPPDSLVDEQQLSGHGWVFRALCEYYLWKKDERALDYLNTMLDNLALRTRGFHDKYPIDPAERSLTGAAIGTRVEKTLNGWMLSTDIGCDFVFLDGLVQAYELTGREDLVPVIDEIVALYKRIDVEEIKAQTHSTLTGLRAMLRYYNLTGDESLLQVAKETYEAYMKRATTENYENYNWFGRPEWTEPCAVLDSYMAAVQLWKYTDNPSYLSDAQLIYYNGICFGQRVNGGFGTSQCCGASGQKSVTVNVDEAAHCCTMRGGEALSSAAQYSAFIKGNRIFLSNLIAGDYALQFRNGKAKFTIDTDYPFTNDAKLSFHENAKNIELSFFRPEWMMDVKLLLNGEETSFKEENGFVVFSGSPLKDDVLTITFNLKTMALDAENPNSMQNVHKYRVGPLLLGVKNGAIESLPKDAPIVKIDRRSYLVGEQPMTTVYHFMDPAVRNRPRYTMQMLFEE